MCGILGQISLKGSLDFDPHLFKKSLDLQSHRGPDASDFYQDERVILGHRRLSIIDLNSHATQPMISDCGSYILVFNGEIYNFEEIKKYLIEAGYIFHTNSDTEVLLNSYIEYGIDCIHKLIGMFAFAIEDKVNDVTYIVRDRLGVKPLYYYANDETIIFSSEVKSIVSLGNIRKELNLNAVSSYFSFRYPILNDTFFEGVSSLAPAHYLKIDPSGLEQVEYWRLSDKVQEQSVDKGEEFYIAKLREILESAVKYRMISDVPIGAFLSGGVDSSVITALMSMASKDPVRTFTIGFEEDGYNEFEFANLIVEKYQTNHTEITLSGGNYLETMEQLIDYKDAPLSVPNEVPLYLMSKELKKYITVVLSGEGADEIFGGYGRIFRSPYDLERIKNINQLGLSEEEKRELVEGFIRKYGVDQFEDEIDHFMNIYSYTSLETKRYLLSNSIDLQRIEDLFVNKFLTYFDELEGESYYNKMMYTFEKIHLVGLLHRVDMTTMAASVEGRVPFVDHRLVEFAFTIPLKYKLKWIGEDSLEKAKATISDAISEVYDTPKYILKKAYEGVVPNDVLYRKKMGFPVPLNDWFGGDFNKYARKLLLSERAKKRNLYRIGNIEDLLDSDRLKEDHGLAMKIWMLVNIEIFIKKNFD